MDDWLPGYPLAESDRYALFMCGGAMTACPGEPASPRGGTTDTARYAVYRLESPGR